MGKKQRIKDLEENVNEMWTWIDHLDNLNRALRERLREHEHDTDQRTMWNGIRADLSKVTERDVEIEVSDLIDPSSPPMKGKKT